MADTGLGLILKYNTMIKLISSTFYKEKETKKELVEFISSAEKLSFGEECQKFERNFADYQDRKHCVFFNSGSSANLALMQALLNMDIVKKGENAGFSAVTWSTNVMPLIQMGLNAIPVDAEIETLNVSSDTLINALSANSLDVLFLTNILGFCSDIEKIAEICDKNGIILIEDNCESLGTVYKNKKLGNFGLASTFSFYVGHHMSTIEGGAVCTDDEDLATMLKIVRAHGWDRNLEKEEQEKIRKDYAIESDFYGLYTFYDLAYNLRPSEINGFLGNQQLQFIDEILEKRNGNFLKLAESIYKKDDLYYPINFHDIDFVSNFAFPLVCKTEKIKEILVEKCKNIAEIRPIVGGNMADQPFYQKYKPTFPIPKTPNAELIKRQGLYFGNNPDLSEEDIEKIIELCTE